MTLKTKSVRGLTIGNIYARFGSNPFSGLGVSQNCCGRPWVTLTLDDTVTFAMSSLSRVDLLTSFIKIPVFIQKV